MQDPRVPPLIGVVIEDNVTRLVQHDLCTVRGGRLRLVDEEVVIVGGNPHAIGRDLAGRDRRRPDVDPSPAALLLDAGHERVQVERAWDPQSVYPSFAGTTKPLQVSHADSSRSMAGDPSIAPRYRGEIGQRRQLPRSIR